MISRKFYRAFEFDILLRWNTSFYLAKNEENPCSTCPINPISTKIIPKPETWISGTRILSRDILHVANVIRLRRLRTSPTCCCKWWNGYSTSTWNQAEKWVRKQIERVFYLLFAPLLGHSKGYYCGNLKKKSKMAQKKIKAALHDSKYKIIAAKKLFRWNK